MGAAACRLQTFPHRLHEGLCALGFKALDAFMKIPVLLIMLSLFASACFAPQAQAQNPDVKTPNKNRSGKYKSAIFKGSGNLIWSNSLASFIGGGQSNTIGLVSGFGPWNAFNSVIAGGYGNTALRDYATIGGGEGNTNSGDGGTIAGGQLNTVDAPYAAIGGGIYNTNTGYAAAVAGGYENTAAVHYATVGGGRNNRAGASNSVVGGGMSNTATGMESSVLGGTMNSASGLRAAVGGGQKNEANGSFSAIPGGFDNSATNYSFAAGKYAIAEHDGSFVWGSAPGVLASLTRSFADNCFAVRASGGARFYTAINGTNVGVSLASGGTAWASLSDSNAKTSVEAVNAREVLAKLSRLPVTEWEYKHDPHRRYFGPMAQDFHTAFGLGNDDKTISTLDADGVLFLSVKGLVEELKERDRKIAELEMRSAEVDDLKAKLQAVEERLNSLPRAP